MQYAGLRDQEYLVNETTTDDAGLLLYGAVAIAKFLGLTERQVRHRVADGELPTFKIGGRAA